MKCQAYMRLAAISPLTENIIRQVFRILVTKRQARRALGALDQITGTIWDFVRPLIVRLVPRFGITNVHRSHQNRSTVAHSPYEPIKTSIDACDPIVGQTISPHFVCKTIISASSIDLKEHLTEDISCKPPTFSLSNNHPHSALRMHP